MPPGPYFTSPKNNEPPTAYVERSYRPPGNAGRWADMQITQRVPVQLTQQDPPQVNPISTRFWGVGKTLDHAWAHINLFQTLNLQTIPAIQAWHQCGIVPKVASAMVIDMGRGRQNPIMARTNIDQPPTMAYGSKAAVKAPPTYMLPPNYMKLM